MDDEIRGSTTIVELLRRYPDGEAAQLMSALSWACAHCGGAFHEPLTMAAKRHARDPRAVLEAFRALERGELSDDPSVRATQERLQACSYAMAHPEEDRLIPACAQHSVLDPEENRALAKLLPMAPARAG
jgi:hypothetical protein